MKIVPTSEIQAFHLPLPMQQPLLTQSIKQLQVKIFVDAGMFGHVAVLILLCGEVRKKGKVKDPRYMQNKKDLRISNVGI